MTKLDKKLDKKINLNKWDDIKRKNMNNEIVKALDDNVRKALEEMDRKDEEEVLQNKRLSEFGELCKGLELKIESNVSTEYGDSLIDLTISLVNKETELEYLSAKHVICID